MHSIINIFKWQASSKLTGSEFAFYKQIMHLQVYYLLKLVGYV